MCHHPNQSQTHISNHLDFTSTSCLPCLEFNSSSLSHISHCPHFLVFPSTPGPYLGHSTLCLPLPHPRHLPRPSTWCLLHFCKPPGCSPFAWNAFPSPKLTPSWHDPPAPRSLLYLVTPVVLQLCARLSQSDELYWGQKPHLCVLSI